MLRFEYQHFLFLDSNALFSLFWGFFFHYHDNLALGFHLERFLRCCICLLLATFLLPPLFARSSVAFSQKASHLLA